MRFASSFQFAVAAVACSAAAPEVAVAAERDAADQEIVLRMRARTPHAVELLEQGEKLALAGSLEDAVGVFRRGEVEDPYGAGLFERRECEALTVLNRRDEAQSACWRAMQDARTPAAVAATVRALVSGPTAPSFADLARALNLVTFERGRAPGNPQLAGAMCDIAESIGDGIMLQHCTDELERIAPDYAPTRRARSALAAQCPPVRFWAGWLTVALLVLLTAADSARRLARRFAPRAPSAGTAAIASIVAMMVALSGSARAQEPKIHWLTSWPIDDKNPEGAVPTPEQFQANPLEGGYWLQDISLKAALASKRGDHEAAIKFYAAMHKAVPDRAISLVKTCAEFEAMGQLENAINACGVALMLEGAIVDDYAHYVRLVLRKPGDLGPKEVAAVTNVINHMKEEEAGKAMATELECDLALRTSNVTRLRECTAALAATAPNDPKTISYQWALALRQRDFPLARQLLERAKAVGIKDDSLKSMQQATEAGASKQRKGLVVTVAGGLALAGVLAWGLVFLSRRRRAVAAPA